jgi:hypothetical protein
MTLHPDIREFIELCLSRKVEFLLVGGYALAFHGAPRFTEDIDLMVLVSPDNASRLDKVLEDFGFGNAGITRDDFLEEDQVIQLGRVPRRLGFLIFLSKVADPTPTPNPTPPTKNAGPAPTGSHNSSPERRPSSFLRITKKPTSTSREIAFPSKRSETQTDPLTHDKKPTVSLNRFAIRLRR